MDLASAAIVVTGTFVIGVLGGLLGVGGGIFLVPFLVFFDIASAKGAVGISLASVIATSASSSWVTAKSGDARLSLALRLEPALVVGAVLASVFGARIDDGALLIAFSVFIMAIAVLLLLRRRLASPSEEPWSTKRLVAMVALAFASGAASGLFGVGGGVLVVPALVLVGRLPLRAAAATSALVLMTSAASAAAVHHLHEPLPGDVVALAIIGVLPGGLLGARLQKRAPERVLEAAFVVLAVVVAGFSLWKGLR